MAAESAAGRADCDGVVGAHGQVGPWAAASARRRASSGKKRERAKQRSRQP
jgi:hypothetical protein